jgi:hypothetical protein
MAADTIQDIFIDPPIAIARLGGSSMPQDAYIWVTAPEPRAGDTTTIAPTWTLMVQQDATIVPVLPTQVALRDGPLVRPVAPFFEIWARMGRAGRSPSTWRDVPLTPALLAKHGAALSDLVLQIDAKNLKAARRTGNPDLGFGTYPPVNLSADQHAPLSLLACSPGGVREPLIPLGDNIPLGHVQMLRSRPQPKPGAQAQQGLEWATLVNVEVIRFRFTPARGLVYGVPAAGKLSQTAPGAKNPRGRLRIAVDPGNDILNPLAGWARTPANDSVEPADTYDGAGPGVNHPALGVVDDTCEVRFQAKLTLPHRVRPLSAAAHAFVGPPDFAPDRRPFLSLADELNARCEPDADSRKMTAEQTDEWVQDLFERVFETVSLFNVDLYREQEAMTLSASQRRSKPIARDHLPGPNHAMGSRDPLRNSDTPMPSRTPDEPLPLTEHARTRHRELADLEGLKDFICNYPGRIQRLVRRPFAIEAGENSGVTSMRMPPFMRNSNAEPLTLSQWQYDLLMQWVDQHTPTAKQQKTPRKLSPKARARRDAVLARVDRNARQPKS